MRRVVIGCRHTGARSNVPAVGRARRRMQAGIHMHTYTHTQARERKRIHKRVLIVAPVLFPARLPVDKDTKGVTMKTRMQDLVIELTRRCNMCCDHCCRGEAQNMDCDIRHIRALFEHVESIDTLTLTGGEPSLVPHIIEAITEEIQRRGLIVERFYMVTNAKQVTREFIGAVMGLYLACENSDSEFASRLDISNDGHHDEVDPENVRKLDVFRFTGRKSHEDGERFDVAKYRNDTSGVINQGRGAELWSRELSLYPFEIDDCGICEETFYMNANGDIIGNCNLSYETQDALKVGNVHDADFCPVKCAERWNAKIDAVEHATVENVLAIGAAV